MGRTIRRVLVANRGEIARRVFRTCRRLGIGTVAVYSDPDARTPFVREADVGIALGGAQPSESYLDGERIVAAALRAGADAIHPGYGFLAESAGFARAVGDAGLTWIGPSPEAIAAMGSKIEARARMETAGVPVLPGATVAGDSDLHLLGGEIGFPLIVKASAGGGGKGMRIVRAPGDLKRAVAAARREALSSFGDDTVFLERYLDAPRHVEIQIMGDTEGTVVSLFERDCSVQRRHQKVVEEAPSPGLDAGLRERMGQAATAAGKELGYVGAGTVEFLVAPGGREFFFLEVNTRLQVEHPVTELVTGLDLVELQLNVAEGRSLPAGARSPVLSGHAVEVRLYAEDPENDFLPVTGTLERFAIDGDVRVDTGVEDGSEISPYYDPMIAKVVAYGASREGAVRLLADALRRAELHGVTTNRDFLVRLLTEPEFASGQTDTHYLERHDPARLGAPLLEPYAERLHAVAAALAAQAGRRAAARVLGTVPSGWRNNPSQLQEVVYAGRHGDWRVGYLFERDGDLAELTLDGESVSPVRLHGCTPELVDLEADGRRLRLRVRRGSGADDLVFVNSPLGQAGLRELPRFPFVEDKAAPGSLASPLPGAVVRVMADAGARVEAGEPLLVIEAMKMEHEIVAPAAGTLSELLVETGTQVEAGATLAIITDD